ncbi:hypothetical protein SLA2020_174200 [Shorea laevis]
MVFGAAAGVSNGVKGESKYGALVWDYNIIETSEERSYDSDLDEMIGTVQQDITTEWADMHLELDKLLLLAMVLVQSLIHQKRRNDNELLLPYDYFLSRLAIIYWWLAQGGVRLAATLNRIFI